MNDIWEARRQQLQDAAQKAALALLDHMNGAAGVVMPLDGRTDATHLVIALEKR